MLRHIMPDIVKRQKICSLPGTATAFDAARAMQKANVAAVIVVDGEGKLQGIVTERDLTRRVMAKDLDAKKAALSGVMTKNPDTLAPSDTARDALELMRTRSYRHLPVKENGRVTAVVSVRDLYDAIKKDLEEDIQETKDFVFNDRYSATH